MQYHIVERAQHSTGSGWGRFGGPDAYLAVLAVPEGVEVPKALRRDVLEARGIKCYIAGEFYRQRRGPRSRYARALALAQQWAAELQAES